jgi:hypothetical protein
MPSFKKDASGKASFAYLYDIPEDTIPIFFVPSSMLLNSNVSANKERSASLFSSST